MWHHGLLRLLCADSRFVLFWCVVCRMLSVVVVFVACCLTFHACVVLYVVDWRLVVV